MCWPGGHDGGFRRRFSRDIDVINELNHQCQEKEKQRTTSRSGCEEKLNARSQASVQQLVGTLGRQVKPSFQRVFSRSFEGGRRASGPCTSSSSRKSAYENIKINYSKSELAAALGATKNEFEGVDGRRWGRHVLIRTSLMPADDFLR